MSANGRNSGLRLAGRLLLCVALATAALSPVTATAERFEPPPLGPRYWVDPVLGYAIGGYDPMSYHIMGEARDGSTAHEVRWAGFVWRFSNAANLQAFLLTPEFYAPRFGGYDVISVARGRLAVGDPGIFVVRDGMLYLFHSAVHRIMFLSDPDQFIAEATDQWSELKSDVPMAISLP